MDFTSHQPFVPYRNSATLSQIKLQHANNHCQPYMDNTTVLSDNFAINNYVYNNNIIKLTENSDESPEYYIMHFP